MKKTKMMIIFTIVCFMFIPRVFATNYMSVSKTNVKVGEEFFISVATDFEISDWNILVTPTDNASGCRLESDRPIPVDGGVGSMANKKCSADAAGTVTLTLSGTITTASTEEHPDGETFELDETLNVTVTEEENPKGLESLTVRGGTLSPTFDSERNTGYVITLSSYEITSFSITATPKTATDTITPRRENGEDYETIDLSYISFVTAGDNSTMLIQILVGEGERQVRYEIQVVRPTKIAPPELTKLTIDGENIPLIAGEYRYKIPLEDKESYFVNATLKDSTNYRFHEYLTPPIETSSKEFEIRIVPKDPTAGLPSNSYYIVIETDTVDPIVSTTTTKKPSGGGGGSSSSGNNQNNIVNPQTGVTPAIIVGIMLVASLVVSFYLYKKNINGYN